jgi:hypothetical protein
MSNEKHNGWSNVETWLVNLHLEGLLDARANEGEPMSAQELVDVIRDSMYGEDGPDCPILLDLIGCAFDRVNWSEIAAHYHNEAAA